MEYLLVCEKTVKKKALRSHMGGHILRAQMGVLEDNVKVAVSEVDPCGFCGQSGHRVRLVKEGRKWTFQPSSTCPFTVPFSLGAAANSTKASPSTNAPIRCTLCPSSSGDRGVVWKYNMAHRISTVHSGRNPDQPLPPALATAMKVSRSEQQALGIPQDSIDASDDEPDTNPQTSGGRKRKRAATVGGENSKRSKNKGRA
ncbi:hypothetical protein PAXRUDRAFT_585015 [Paxillus rubicundulus Ve08.2h10]|uniref:Uncharacterized protein n=1 Tax=Paxillus rubicundulus Ve08.2h10 TaxID=930991 RepID=A0A0D0BQ42_9AGAM|nr:hypothetical protein PAXRUDRAFT_585015 [Paxillus rubicundulus Ve08.2h10]